MSKNRNPVPLGPKGSLFAALDPRMWAAIVRTALRPFWRRLGGSMGLLT
jgi:hypothetical protein